MLLGLLILGLAGGASTALAVATIGAPWWIVLACFVVAGNVSVVATALLRLALLVPDALHADGAWGESSAARLPGRGHQAG